MGVMRFASLPVVGALIVGLLGVIGLVYRSLHISQPVIDLRVLGTKLFPHVFVFFSCN